MSQVILSFIAGLSLAFLIEELKYAKPLSKDCKWIWVRWMEENQEHYSLICSVCGEEAMVDVVEDKPLKTPYCPFCGSPMINGEK